jgi:ribonuclease HI
MDDFAELHDIATKRERADGVRLARRDGLSALEALRRTLQASAGLAGIDALVAARQAVRDATAARESVRTALRAAALARASAVAEGSAAWQAWFDGSARPNPGRCAIGALLRSPAGTTWEIAETVGDGDSSDAEYRALIAVLDAALAQGASGLTVYGDSRVVIDDVTGPDAGAAPALAAYRIQARARLERLPGTRLRWVPRHRNGVADALSQRAFATSGANADG